MDLKISSNIGLDSEQQEIWGEPDSDEDYEMLHEFDVEKAWKNLLSLPHCMKIPLRCYDYLF